MFPNLRKEHEKKKVIKIFSGFFFQIIEGDHAFPLCPICQDFFVSEKHLHDHMKTHPENVQSHPKTDTEDTEFNCDTCDKTFKAKSGLKSHILYHGMKNFKCELCDKAFYTKSALKRHMLVHSKEKKYLCEVCNEGFVDRKSLKSHMIVHSKKKFSCPICEKRYSNAKGVSAHLEKAHQTSSEK